MFLVNEDGEEWDGEEWDVTTNCRGENLISTCYLLQSIVAHFEKDTVKSGGEVGPVQT